MLLSYQIDTLTANISFLRWSLFVD